MEPPVVDYRLLDRLSNAAVFRYAVGDWSLDRALAYMVTFLADTPASQEAMLD